MASEPCPGCGRVSPVRWHGARDRLGNVPGVYHVRWCKDCGLGVTDPRPASLTALYPPDYHLKGDVPSTFAPTLARIRKRLEPGTALDVGTGRGAFLEALARLGWHARGVEPDTPAAEAARARGFDVQVATFEEAELPEAAFDLVTLLQVLEHLPDPVAALRRLRALLRPGGTAVLAVPNADSWEARLTGPAWFHLDVPRHLVHFSPRGLRRLLVREGLHVESVHGDLDHHAAAGAGATWDRFCGPPKRWTAWKARALFVRAMVGVGRIASPPVVEIWARRPA